MTCPRCRRKQYYKCHYRSCVSHRVPKGKKGQVRLGHDGLACPYCGFKAHIDYWRKREMVEASRSGAAW